MAISAERVKEIEPSPEERGDREMSTVEHLAEVRTRIAHAAAYIVLGMVAAWFFYDPLLNKIIAPVRAVQGQGELQLILSGFMDGFFLRLQVSAVAGTILAFPLLLREAWGFVKPALGPSERRVVYLIVPLCVVLFAAGVACAFYVVPLGLAFLLRFLPPGTQLLQRLNDYVLFMAKMALAFGLTFQIPVVALILARLGIVRSSFLLKYWRQAIVIFSIIAAIITPPDAFTQIAVLIPLSFLYGLSILLVKLVERRRDDETA